MELSNENARDIIIRVKTIIADSSTIRGTSKGIGAYDVIIVVLKSDRTHDGPPDSYIIATYTPNDDYPLEGEHDIHRELTLVGTNQHTSPDGVCWVIEQTQSFHNPTTTEYPRILFDGIHIMFVQLPNFENVRDDTDVEDDDDGSSWGEGSVVSEGDLSEADTDSVVSENGVGDNGYESVDKIQRILPTNTITHIRQTMTIELITRYVDLLRANSEKKRWIRWYVFFANGNRLHTCNNEFLNIARILKFAVWTCSQHSGIFEGMEYADCVKHIVNVICEN